MATPLRKDSFRDDVTTTDLAQAQNVNSETTERKPLLAPDELENAPGNVKQIPVKVERTSTDATPTAMEERRVERQGLTSTTDRDDDLIDHNRDNPFGQSARTPERSAQSIAEHRSSEETDSTPLFPGAELEVLRHRWKEVQTAFVDEPRSAVEQADRLVASAMKRLAEVFADERTKLEKQWDRGDDVSTEDLRLALQRYRTFFQRLLAV